MAFEEPAEGRFAAKGQGRGVGGAGTAPVATLAIGPLAGAAAALLAGMAVWAFGQAFGPVFALPPQLANLPTPAPVHLLNAQAEAGARANVYNTLLTMGLFGGLVGAALATAEGWGRRSWGMAAAGGPISAAVGLLFGGLAAWLALLLDACDAARLNLVDLGKTALVQAVMLATLGAGLGIGVGLLSRSRKTVLRCLLGGWLGGCLAGFLYPVAAAWLLPAADTESVIPRGPVNHLLWIGMVAGLLGATIPAGSSRGKPLQYSAPQTLNPEP